MRGLWRALTRPRGTPLWDAVLRGTGIAALAALYPAARWEEVAGLAGFFCVTALTNGPLSPLLPATFEPMLMVAGRVWPPLLVAAVAGAAVLWIELLNLPVYRALLLHPRTARARASRPVEMTVAIFRRSPFLCVWLCSWSPLPYYVARSLAAITGYSLPRYLLATILGRLPRFWFFAAIGTAVPLSSTMLLGISVVMIGIAAFVLIRNRGHLEVLQATP